VESNVFVDHRTFTASVRALLQKNFGLWLSLVERFVRDEEAAGSNPASPTMSGIAGFERSKTGARNRRCLFDEFESRAKLYSAFVRFGSSFSTPLFQYLLISSALGTLSGRTTRKPSHCASV
jgi:hypothetical protein